MFGNFSALYMKVLNENETITPTFSLAWRTHFSHVRTLKFVSTIFFVPINFLFFVQNGFNLIKCLIKLFDKNIVYNLEK